MACYPEEKAIFAARLKTFAETLGTYITQDNEWTIRGFIDKDNMIHTISADTKAISKVLELHIFPYFLKFAEGYGYGLELATQQNWYPDLTVFLKSNPDIKFAVDLKTTYRLEEYSGFCNGFTLGSHGKYFTDRTSNKNIQYPYGQYSGHFCLGIIYSRAVLDDQEEMVSYHVKDIAHIPAVIRDLICFAEEKWKIASDKSGSGNTASIGSIQKIEDILNGNGVFVKAGEALFDEYWCNYGKEITISAGKKKLTSFADYLEYKGFSPDLNNPKAPKKKDKRKGTAKHGV